MSETNIPVDLVPKGLCPFYWNGDGSCFADEVCDDCEKEWGDHLNDLKQFMGDPAYRPKSLKEAKAGLAYYAAHGQTNSPEAWRIRGYVEGRGKTLDELRNAEIAEKDGESGE